MMSYLLQVGAGVGLGRQLEELLLVHLAHLHQLLLLLKEDVFEGLDLNKQTNNHHEAQHSSTHQRPCGATYVLLVHALLLEEVLLLVGQQLLQAARLLLQEAVALLLLAHLPGEALHQQLQLLQRRPVLLRRRSRVTQRNRFSISDVLQLVPSGI